MLGGVQGAESLFLWRAIGAAVLTLVPATAYSLKVCLRPRRHDDLCCALVCSALFQVMGCVLLYTPCCTFANLQVPAFASAFKTDCACVGRELGFPL